MAEISVLLRGREGPIAFQAENWKFTDRFLRLIEGDHLVAQFPNRAVMGVWFEEPVDGTDDLATAIVFPVREAAESSAERPADIHER